MLFCAHGLNPLGIMPTQPKPPRNYHDSFPSDIAARRRAFRQMHVSGCFVIPNPWDVGSARYLQGLGFKALATTSSGVAWSLGQCDGWLDRQAVLDHLRDMAGGD
jgi:2-methylisocitrate lyase-like PEP mutase family enzyme